MKVVHHNDLDGECSAAIILHAFPEQKIELMPMDYKDDFPFQRIGKNEEVWIVDFSLQGKGQWERLLAITEQVVWIDHHKTALASEGPQQAQDGLRKDGEAACLLTWKFVHPHQDIPYPVRLVSDYDIWAKLLPETDDFHFGMEGMDTAPDAPIWKSLFEDYRTLVEEIVEKGKLIHKRNAKENQSYLESYGFETIFEGFNCIACNKGMAGSGLFDSAKDKDYDIMIPFVFDGRQYTVSLFSTKDHIDVSTIAKKYGGGGHKGAAGFQCEVLPFWMKKPVAGEKVNIELAGLKKQFPLCNDEDCMYERECSHHRTAGEFRTEDGMTPLLSRNDKGEWFCEKRKNNCFGCLIWTEHGLRLERDFQL